MTKRILIEDLMSPFNTGPDREHLITLFKVYHKYNAVLSHRYIRLRRIHRTLATTTTLAVLTLSALGFVNPAISMGNIVVVSANIATKKLNLHKKTPRMDKNPHEVLRPHP